MKKKLNPIPLETSYVSKVYHYLKKYRSITQWECYEAGLTTRLSAQIYELRHTYNQNIIDIIEVKRNMTGGYSNYTRYIYQSDYKKWEKENPNKTDKDAVIYFRKLNQMLHLQDKTTDQLKEEIEYHQKQISRCQYLLKQKEESTQPPITEFRGRYAFLNNRYHSLFVLNGILYPSAEIAYIALHTDDTDLQEDISKSTEEEARQILSKEKIKDSWPEEKTETMEQIIRAKFQQNPALAKQLITTGNRDILYYNTHHDTYWGICTCKNCKTTGDNLLGKILMAERKFELQNYSLQQTKQERTLFS